MALHPPLGYAYNSVRAPCGQEIDRLRGLRAFLDEHRDQAPLAWVIYLGREWRTVGPNIALVPWWWL